MIIATNQGFEGLLSARLQLLARRVADAAHALCAHGEEPTARAVRRALHGGSPNEVGPLLRAWRESPEGVRALRSTAAGSPVPSEVADLLAELWQRASIAALLEASDSVRRVESESTEAQVKGLRDQLQRELIKYGELTAQSARHEARARRLAQELDESEGRERRHLRDLGAARARIAELEATVEQLKANSSPRTIRPKRASSGRASTAPPRLASAKRAALRRPDRKPNPRSKVTANRPKQRSRRKAKAGQRR